MTEYYTFPCGCSWPIIGPPPHPDLLPLLDFDDRKIPDSCPAVWDLFASGLTKGVFQLEKNLGRKWSKRLKPESLEDIAALVSLLRPGCLMSEDDRGVSMTENYCRRKNSEELVESVHPAYDKITQSTYNIIVYQETIMRIGAELAGFNLVEVDELRKAVGKKDQKKLAKVKEKFLRGTKTQGIITKNQADKIWGWIEKSGRYAFNKCIAADTKIVRSQNRNRYGDCQYEVGHMYQIRNDIDYAKKHGHSVLRRKWKRLGNYGTGLSIQHDGRIRKNTIVDIQPAGIRPLYRVVLEDESYVDVTINHKFPTTSGELTTSEIMRQESVYLYKCGSYEPYDKKYGFSNVTVEELRSRKDEGLAVNGCFGPDNYAYTNGSWSDFKRAKTDSSLDNLKRLCVSCHKKIEYANGRRKRGEKGYPSKIVRVQSVRYVRSGPTYDVTMEAPYHNFVVNDGIVTCNSHAVSYGRESYDTAYLKAHFPFNFFAGWLRYADDKSKPFQEVAELVEESKLFNINLLPPDVRTRNSHFRIEGASIRFGLADIKGVGEKQVAKLVSVDEQLKQNVSKGISSCSWFEFLLFGSNELMSTTVKAFIRTGAFDHWGIQRKRMLREYEVWSSLKEGERKHAKSLELYHRGVGGFDELFPRGEKRQAQIKERADLLQEENFAALLRAISPLRSAGGGASRSSRTEDILSEAYLLTNPPSPLTDSIGWKSLGEKNFLGASITCEATDGCDLSEANVSCSEYLAGRTGRLIFGVQIINARVVRTKRGRNPGSEMAFLTISDSTGYLNDVVVFPDDFALFRDALEEGNVVILEGQRDHRENSDSLIVKRVSLVG